LESAEFSACRPTRLESTSMTSIRLAVGTLALLVVSSSSVLAQGRGGMGMMGGMQPGLLNVTVVQEDLKLSDEQKSKAATLAEESQAKMRDMFQTLREASQEERQEKMREFASENEKGIKEILDEKQMARFKQISLQAQGVRAFMNPDIQEKLKISEDQKGSMQSIMEDMQGQMRDIFQEAAGDRQAMQEKMATLQKETFSKVKELMTEDQKKAWGEMIGTPIELPAMGGGGRRGGPPAV
jgi:hypothetical protein